MLYFLHMQIFNKLLNIKETIDVYLSNPDQVLYQGKATGFSSFNKDGEFSIISKHTNFRSLIENKILIYINNKETKEFKITKGVVSFANNSLEAYVV